MRFEKLVFLNTAEHYRLGFYTPSKISRFPTHLPLVRTDSRRCLNLLPPKQNNLLIAVKLKELASHRIWINKAALAGDVTAQGGVFFVDLDGEHCAYLASSIAIETVSAEYRPVRDPQLPGRMPSAQLECIHCEVDPVIEGLIRLALLASEKTEKLTPVFAQHLAAVFHAHVLGRDEFSPGKMTVPGTLARWQERRAKEMMSAQLDGEVCIELVAKACNLSIAHFSRAFAATVGTPPHRWLVQRRIYRACDLLRTCRSMALAEIACCCGFADQSHFTRVFKKVVGISPGVWRRKMTASLEPMRDLKSS